MNGYLRTGIKLSRETRQAWELAGFRVTAPGSLSDLCCDNESLVVNYGSPTPMACNPSILLNDPERIHRTRVEELPQYVGEYMPLVKFDQPVIVKANGSKGKGKIIVGAGSPVVVQRFLYPAEEYRVITWDIPGVMEPEVLAWSRKNVEDPFNPASPKDFQYLPTYDIHPNLARNLLVAHEKLGLNFVGWDVLLHNGLWWIIEANSAPGVGEQTARRIRKRLRRVLGQVHPQQEVAA